MNTSRVELPENFLALNCNELKQFALVNFDVKLGGDKATMQNQVKELVDSHNAKISNPSGIAPDNRLPEKAAGLSDIERPTIHPAAAQFLKNPVTGVVWPATEQLRKVPGLVPCLDAEGTPLDCPADTDAVIDSKIREEHQRLAAALNISVDDLKALINGEKTSFGNTDNDESGNQQEP